MPSNITSKLQTLTAEIAKIHDDHKTQLVESFKDTFATFFDAHPLVTSVYWSQSAPAFNDGDPCVFYVRDFYVTLDHPEQPADSLDDSCLEDSSFYLSGYIKDYPDADDVPQINAIITDLAALEKIACSATMRPVMESTFGSSSLVVATRAGFDVRDYDCGY